MPNDICHMQDMTSPMCRGKTQRLDFSSSVSFVDVSRPAEPRYKEYPVLQARWTSAVGTTVTSCHNCHYCHYGQYSN